MSDDRDAPKMRIEHSVEHSNQMHQLDVDTHIRIWFEHDARYIDIRVCTSRDCVLITHHQAPGGFAYASPLTLQPNNTNGVVIK